MSTIEATTDHALGSIAPWLDEFGLLHTGDTWVALSATERRLVEPLVARFGRVVRADELTAAVWDRPVHDGALKVLVQRTRRRLAPVGLTVHNVRRRGFVLDATDARVR